MRADDFDAATFDAARARLQGDVDAFRVAAGRDLVPFDAAVILECADLTLSRAEVAARVERMVDSGLADADAAADRANAALQWVVDHRLRPVPPPREALVEPDAPTIDAALLERARQAAKSFDDGLSTGDPLRQRMMRELRVLENGMADLSIMREWVGTGHTTRIVLHFAAGFGVGAEEGLERFAEMLRWVVALVAEAGT